MGILDSKKVKEEKAKKAAEEKAAAEEQARQEELDSMVDFTVTEETVEELNSKLPEGEEPLVVGGTVKLSKDHPLLKNDESEEGDDSEDSEEGDDSEEEDGVEEFVDATGKVAKVSVYKGASEVAVISLENHGKDFIKIANAKAKAIGGLVKAYKDPSVPTVDKNTVKILNASGNLVREYSKSVHGKDYKELAEGYVEKHGEKRGFSIEVKEVEAKE